MEYIKLPSTLAEFSNYETTIEINRAGQEQYVICGMLDSNESILVCPCCGAKMHIHHSRKVELRHLPFGRRLSIVRFERHRYRCLTCKHTEMQNIPFKAENHRMTTDLLEYTQELLASGLTNKAVGEITGFGKNTVKDVDTRRLQKLYTVTTEDGERRLTQP